MAARSIRVRYAGTCSGCGASLTAGTTASWEKDGKLIMCVHCQDATQVQPLDPDAVASGPTVQPAPIAGVAGDSARLEYERRHDRREQHIDQKYGRLAGVVKFVVPEPQTTTAWAVGADGERRLADYLTEELGDSFRLLNDRKVPKRRGNIDHLLVGPSGVWVVDAKQYSGRIEQRDAGVWFKRDYRIYVRGRDRTKLAAGLQWQVDAVRHALGGIDAPITPALCFIRGEWPLFAKPFQQDGVWVLSAKMLLKLARTSTVLSDAAVEAVATRLAAALPPMASGSS